MPNYDELRRDLGAFMGANYAHVSKEDREDIIQDTLIRVHKREHVLIPGKSPRSYAYQIAKNLTKDFFRNKKRRIQACKFDDIEPDDPSVEFEAPQTPEDVDFYLDLQEFLHELGHWETLYWRMKAKGLTIREMQVLTKKRCQFWCDVGKALAAKWDKWQREE